jgi:hypothetical protein
VQPDNEGTAMQSKNFNDYSKCKQLMWYCTQGALHCQERRTS